MVMLEYQFVHILQERALGPIVKQDTRLDNRFLDLRTPANQAIFTLQAAVCQVQILDWV